MKTTTSAPQVSVLIFNKLAGQVSHTILHEHDEELTALEQAGFKMQRKGHELQVYVSSETELFAVRRITHLPLFIKW